MAARLKRDIKRSAVCRCTRIGECDPLSMGASAELGLAKSDGDAVFHDYAADRGIRPDAPPHRSCAGQCFAHPPVVIV